MSDFKTAILISSGVAITYSCDAHPKRSYKLQIYFIKYTNIYTYFLKALFVITLITKTFYIRRYYMYLSLRHMPYLWIYIWYFTYFIWKFRVKIKKKHKKHICFKLKTGVFWNINVHNKRLNKRVEDPCLFHMASKNCLRRYFKRFATLRKISCNYSNPF